MSTDRRAGATVDRREQRRAFWLPSAGAEPVVSASAASHARAEGACHGRQDEFPGIVHRAGHALQERLGRREGVPRPRRLADRRGHQRPGSGRHHGREPDALARRAQAGRRMVRRPGQGPGSGGRGRGLELHRGGGRACRSTPRRPAPTPCWWSRPTTTSRRRKGMYQHFKAINDAIGIPIIIYNIPPRSVIDMSVDTMKRLYELKNIAGVKDATANMARVSQQRAAMRAGLQPALRRGHHGARLQRPWRARLHLGDVERRAAAVLGVPGGLRARRLRGRAEAAGQARAAAHQPVRRDEPGAGQVRDVADRQVLRRRCACRWFRRRRRRGPRCARRWCMPG